MLPADVKVVQQQEEAFIDSAGNVSTRIRITFTVGGHGPFSVALTEDDFRAGRGEEEITKLADQARRLQIRP